MSREGFITLHEAQPQQLPRATGTTRPPVPPPPPGYRALQQQQQQYAPAQANTHVKIADLREERPLTAEEAREASSEYFVIRITPADKDGYASDGTKRRCPWERALQVEEPGTTNQEVARTVRLLNRTTIPVARKKEDLTEQQKRQVEYALVGLQKKFDNEWFQTTLVQLEDRVEEKPKERGSKEKEREQRERERERERRKERRRKEYGGLFGVTRVPSKPHSKSKQRPKAVVAERVSITAYFKLAPRPGVHPSAILQTSYAQRNAQLRSMQQAYPQPVGQPGGGHYAPPPVQNIPPPGAGETRGPNPAHHVQTYAHSPRTAIIQPAPQRRPHAAVRRASPRRHSPHHRRLSPRIIHNGARSPISTDESVYSETFSVVNDDDTDCTPPSSPSYVSSRDSFDRLRQKGQYRESPVHYGIPPNSGAGQGAVHIQPHRPNERRESFREHRHSISAPNQGPFPQQTSAQAPGPAFFPPRPGNLNMPGAVPPMPPSPPAAVQVPVGPRAGPV
ncbi:hypothetical protein C8A01DRAFT_11992, partial [Parachaetomium inaequale]